MAWQINNSNQIQLMGYGFGSREHTEQRKKRIEKVLIFGFNGKANGNMSASAKRNYNKYYANDIEIRMDTENWAAAATAYKKNTIYILY